MYWKRQLSISRPQSEVEAILKQQLRTNMPVGSVQKDCFTVYKSVSHTSLGQNSIHLFRFKGEYSQSGSDTELIYTVSLPAALYIVSALLCALAIYITVSFLINGGTFLYAGILLFLSLLHIIGMTGQGHTCIERFEKQLTEDSPGGNYENR